MFHRIGLSNGTWEVWGWRVERLLYDSSCMMALMVMAEGWFAECLCSIREWNYIVRFHLKTHFVYDFSIRLVETIFYS